MKARRGVVVALAAVTVIAGIDHGVGEILQGPVAPPALAFPSWRGVAAFDVLAGEPAMSVVPNLLVSGVLTILLSLAFLLVATAFSSARYAGPALLALAVGLLLVGGGFGPPLVGFVVAVLVMRERAPLPWWRRRSPRSLRAVAPVWPWALAACLAAWLTLFPGLPVVGSVRSLDGAVVVPIVFAAAVAATAAAILTACAYDVVHESS